MKLAILVSCSAAAAHAAYVMEVFHRVFHPDIGAATFVPRGHVLIDSTPSYVSASSITDDLASFAQTLSGYASDDRALYQVALESGGSWEFSSIRYCHLSSGLSEEIVLHTSLSQPFKPYALDFFVAPIPLDGACPSDSVTKETFGVRNTTVSFQRPHLPPLAELRGQPQVQATTLGGEPVAPAEEKSFLQKYWIYMVAVTVALMLSGGAPEEGPKRAEA